MGPLEKLLSAGRLLHGLMLSHLQETPGHWDVPPYLAACPQPPPAPAWDVGITGGVMPEVGVDSLLQPQRAATYPSGASFAPPLLLKEGCGLPSPLLSSWGRSCSHPLSQGGFFPMGRRQARSRRGSALVGAARRSQNCSFVQKTGGQTAACPHPACGHRSSGAGRRRAALSPREAAGASRASLPTRLSFPASHHPAGCGANWDDWDGLAGAGTPAWKVPPPPSAAVCTAMEQLGVLQPRGFLEKSQPLMIALEI